jgi:hypothetical protein
MKGLSGNGEGLTPRPRTRRRRAVDAATARIFKMPPGHHDYTLTPGVRVPMRDGVELLTDVYAPVTKSLGTLLIRTPYGRTGLIALLTARYYATHGYHVVNQRCRGTFGSDGVFQPFRPEIDDGADTVAWLRRQAWFGGRFALCGASYLGYGLGVDDGSAAGAGRCCDRDLRARQPLGDTRHRSLFHSNRRSAFSTTRKLVW